MESSARQHGKQRVIITGATGYVGTHLIEHLCKNYGENYELVTFVRDASSLTAKSFGGHRDKVKVEELDFKSAKNVHDKLNKYSGKVDAIVHLGFNTDFFPKDQAQYCLSNYATCDHLITAAIKLEMNVKFVFISSTETVGYTDDPNDILSESSHGFKPNSIYAESKAQCESLLLAKCAKQTSVKLVILKPTGIYGFNERFFFWQGLTYISSGLSIVLPSPMNGTVMFTHIEDFIQSIVLILLKSNDQVLKNGDTFIVCPDANTKMTYRQILLTVSDKLKLVHQPLFNLPLFIGKLVTRFFKPLLNLQYDRVFLYHQNTLEETVRNRWYDNSKVKSTLGFRPKYSMQQGIEKVVQQEIDSHNLRPSLFARIAYHLF